MDASEKLDLFLQELSELTKKHGIEIGCLGSMHLWDDAIKKYLADDLCWDEKEEKYTFKAHS